MKLKLLNWLVLVAVATALTDPVLARPDTASNSASTAADEIVPVVELDSASLRDAIVVLAKEAHLDVQFDPKLLQTNGPDGHSIPIIPPVVNVKWTNVTARQALQALLDKHGLEMMSTPGSPILRVVSMNP